jgi:hypothetical protein
MNFSSLFWLIFLGIYSNFTFAARYNCCEAKFSRTGVSCESPNSDGNATYFCAVVAGYCSQCQLEINTSSTSCYQCCVSEPDLCGYSYSYISYSSWSKYNSYVTRFLIFWHQATAFLSPVYSSLTTLFILNILVVLHLYVLSFLYSFDFYIFHWIMLLLLDAISISGAQSN